MACRNIAAFFFVAGTLVACGGGGGGTTATGPVGTTSGNIAAPASGPGDVAGYFPMTNGDTWLYDEPSSVSSTTIGAQATVTVSGTKTVIGTTTSVFSLSTTATGATAFDQYYGASPGGVTFYGNNDPTDQITNKTIPYAQLLFPVAAGPASHITGSGWQISTDSAGNPITVTFDQ
jgi:hypothetical protein